MPASVTQQGRLRGPDGRYLPDPNRPPTRKTSRSKKARRPPAPPPTAPQAGAYAQYRDAALRLMRHLQEMMPPETKPGARKKQAAESAKSEVPSLQHERLLSKGQGVIDAFETLGLLVIRLIDKERESLEHANPQAVPTAPYIDEVELDRRYREELDRICRRRESAGDGQP